MSFSKSALFFAAVGLQTYALPTFDGAITDVEKCQAGPVGALPEFLMVAIVDAFGLRGQIIKELFGKLDQDEPYVCSSTEMFSVGKLVDCHPRKTQAIAEWRSIRMMYSLPRPSVHHRPKSNNAF